MKNENINITWLRALACLLIVVLHASNLSVFPYPSLLGLASAVGRSFSILGVPVFAMVSGYLLFSKTEEPSLKLAGRRFWNIFKIIAYFGTIYYVYDTFRGQGYYPYFDIFLHSWGKSYGHLWYLYAILPGYLLSAFIHLPKNQKSNFYLGFFIIMSFILFVTEAMQNYPFFIASLYQDYRLNILFVYMIIGFALGNIKKSKASVFFTAYTALSVIDIFFLWYNLRKGEYLKDPLEYLQSVSFFLGVMCLDVEAIMAHPWGRRLHTMLSTVSKYSMGIYGWHMIFIFFFPPFWAGFGLPGRYIFPLTLISTFFSALLIAMADTWFWTNVRARLASLWRKVSTRLQKT